MQIHPYLNFNGDCAEAFRFYHATLGGKLEMQTQGESPLADQATPESRDRILHARLDIGDALLMGSDRPPGDDATPVGFAVSLTVADPLDADRIFAALATSGNVTMPIAETFWATRFGMLVDRFGTPWMINCERPDAR